MGYKNVWQWFWIRKYSKRVTDGTIYWVEVFISSKFFLLYKLHPSKEAADLNSGKMLTNINSLKKVRALFDSDNNRTKLAIRNIIGSLFIKGGSVLASLLLVPLTINYVDAAQYGIWLALSSIIAWFSFFDIGLGNGLKNKLAEALATGKVDLARKYVSTTYALLIIIVSFFVILFVFVNKYITWSSLLNLPFDMEMEISRLVLLIIIFFSFQFVLQTIVVILTAHQNVSMASLLGFLGNLISLLIIAVLIRTTKGSLYNLGIAFSIAPLLVYTVASIYYFKNNFKTISPSWSHVDFSYSRELMGLGLKFFIIQIAAIILYQSTNLLLVKMYGPEEVTSYNVSYKYFGIINMLFSIIMAPFWVAFSDAFHKKDIQWIRNTVNKLIRLWTGVTALGLIMLLVSEPAINLWVGPTVKYSWFDGMAMFLYFITSTFGSIFVLFINGTGKVFIQFLTSILSPILFIPLALLLGRYFGQAGIVYSSIICNFYGIFLAPIQYKKIINYQSNGIWNK